MDDIAYRHEQIDFSRPGKHHYRVAFPYDGSWGNSLVPMTVINGLCGVNANGVAVFGGTHGNEYEGQVALKRLCRDLDPAVMSGRVIVVPQLSQSACVAGTRTSPMDGVNMNRAFPGNPRGTLSYRISNFVKTRIFPEVRVVLDIHAGGNEGSFPICTSFHPIPDPAQRAEIAKVALLFDTPFVGIYSNEMHSGLLTDEGEADGKITIGGEFGGGETCDPDGVRHAYEGTLNVLRHYGLLPGGVVKIRAAGAQTMFVRLENLEDYIPCPFDAVWEPRVRPGAGVCAGEIVGCLHDFSDHTSAPREVRAHRDGIVIMLHLSARPRKGQTLFVIAVPLPDGALMGDAPADDALLGEVIMGDMPLGEVPIGDTLPGEAPPG